MSLTNFCKSLQSIETITVLNSEVSGNEFTVTFQVEEVEEGWLALEALARLCTKHKIRLTSEATNNHQSLFFRLVGTDKQLSDSLGELEDLADPNIPEIAQK